jgi:hypothetical protein
LAFIGVLRLWQFGGHVLASRTDDNVTGLMIIAGLVGTWAAVWAIVSVAEAATKLMREDG